MNMESKVIPKEKQMHVVFIFLKEKPKSEFTVRPNVMTQPNFRFYIIGTRWPGINCSESGQIATGQYLLRFKRD